MPLRYESNLHGGGAAALHAGLLARGEAAGAIAANDQKTRENQKTRSSGERYASPAH